MVVGKKIVEAYLRKPYLRILTPDEESGTYAAEIPEFPGCVAQGDTVQEAYASLEKAALGWIEAALDMGQTIPEPTTETRYGGKVALRLPKSLHRQAALAAEQDGVSLNQFIVVAVSEKVGANSTYASVVRRLADWMQRKPVQQVFNVTFVKQYEQVAGTGPSMGSFSVPELKEVPCNARN